MLKIKEFLAKDINFTHFGAGQGFPFTIALLLTAGVLFDVDLLHGRLFTWIFAFIGSIIGFILLWTFMKASFAVLKTFFLLSAELSLLLFLAQSYCNSKIRGADGALGLLITLSVLYIIFEFAETIKDAWIERFRVTAVIEKSWRKFVGAAVYTIFSLMFMYTIYQVVRPVILSLCIYQH